MIDLNVSLASSGVVNIPGYAQLLSFGYTKNRNIYRLCIDASDEWAGLAIRAFWHVPDGDDPPASLVVDGAVTVPALVTSQSGSGCITFEGTNGDKRITSADLQYRVSTNSGTEEGTAPEPGTDSWQQFINAVREDAKAAEKSNAAAQEAAQKADKALTDTIAAKDDALTAIDEAKNAAIDEVDNAVKPAHDAAHRAAESADKADAFAQAASASMAEATRQAELASQSAEGKGYMYLEDHDDSGVLSLVIADSITDEITLRDDGAGVLEVVYT